MHKKDNQLVFTSEQSEYIIDIPKNFNKILVQLSGGINSALMAYSLAQYKSKCRQELSITPVTMLVNDAPFDVHYAKHIIEWVEHKADIKFEKLQATVSNRINYKQALDTFTKGIYKHQGADAHFIGLGTNDYQFDHFKQNKSTSVFYPLVKLDKSNVAEFFNTYELKNLYDVTTSCNNRTSEQNHHCGNCSKCKERLEYFEYLEPEDNIGRYIDLPRGLARDWSDA